MMNTSIKERVLIHEVESNRWREQNKSQVAQFSSHREIRWRSFGSGERGCVGCQGWE